MRRYTITHKHTHARAYTHTRTHASITPHTCPCAFAGATIRGLDATVARLESDVRELGRKQVKGAERIEQLNTTVYDMELQKEEDASKIKFLEQQVTQLTVLRVPGCQSTRAS